uniref:Uncharacterized protein n=1 Tax=Brassica campestris TaxID=3711 RepID=M4ETH2_BRACM
MVCFLDPVFVSFMYSVNTHKDAEHGDFNVCVLFFSLWKLFLKDITQGKRETYASKPRTGVEFGSHDTLIEQDVEDHVSPKAKSMKMLQQELINNPCKRTQPKLREDQSLSDVNYSRKVLCSVIVSATKQPCCKNPDRYEKFVDEGNKMQKRLYFPKREVRQSYFSYVPSGGAVYARSHEAASSQEMMLHVSVWDRLGQPGDQKYHILSKVRLNLDENRTPKQLGRAFSAAYIEQHNETFQREVPAVVYMHRVLPPLEARKPKSGTITYTEPHIMHNFSKKRRYGIINPNSVDASVGDLSSVLQYKQAKQDVEKPSLLSSQSKKPDIFSEIVNMKQKLQQLDNQINQAKHLKKQKFGELKGSVQSGELQQKHDDTESSIIHVTNVYFLKLSSLDDAS